MPTVVPDYHSVTQGQILVDDMYDQKNIIVSPMSLNMALGMASNGATEQVKNEIANFTHIPTDIFTTIYAPAFMKEVENNSMLKTNNGMWYEEDYTLNPDFQSAMEQYYQAALKAAPMNEHTKDEINQLVSDNTDQMIPKFIDEMAKGTSAILVNTILFQGKWTKPFKAENTEKKDFTEFNGTKIKVDMMRDVVDYYYENDAAIGFEKEYGTDKKYSFIAVLPKKEGEFKLSDLNLDSFLKSKTGSYEVDIQLPKFTYEWNDEGHLNDSLIKNGVSSIFDETQNPLGNVFTGLPEEIKIYASDINQSCKIMVDEDGTKAAAATAIFIMKSSAAPVKVKVKKVYLNRPFAYIIMDNELQQALFVGKVVNTPQQ